MEAERGHRLPYSQQEQPTNEQAVFILEEARAHRLPVTLGASRRSCTFFHARRFSGSNSNKPGQLLVSECLVRAIPTRDFIVLFNKHLTFSSVYSSTAT